MCLLVYPKDEIQIQAIISYLNEMGIVFENSENIPYQISETKKEIILKRVKEYQENQNIGIPYEEVTKNIREKYGF